MATSGRADLESELPPMELNRLKFGTRVKVGGEVGSEEGGREGAALDLMVLESLPRFGTGFQTKWMLNPKGPGVRLWSCQ